jgi:hypothetical protein
MQGRAFLAGSDHALPVEDGRAIVATVNGQSISLDEFIRERDPGADETQVRQGYGSARDFELLERFINVKLIVQESATMGLRDDPEIRKQVDVTARGILRDALMARLVKDVTAEPAAVEEIYRELVKEWKTESLIFQDEASAKRVHEQLATGASFADLAAREVAAKTAVADTDTEYHGRKNFLPPIADALGPLTVGQVGPVVRIDAGFVVFRVVDSRYPEQPEARKEAEKRALNQAQSAFLQAHDRKLKTENAVIHQDVLAAVDYAAATPGIQRLLTDTRVVADLKGAAPVTVADLTDNLRMQSFHGDDLAAQGKRMNAAKEAALDATLGRRLLNAEALKLGLDKTPEYRERVQAYEDSLVFGSFIRKVIAPDSKMTEEEVQKYYAEHLKEFSSPEMVRLRTLAFSARSGAEDAMAKLRGGADYGWLAANADGQVAKGTPGLLALDGQLVTTDSMPDGVQKALLGGKAGEYTLYAAPEGHFYVLAVQTVVPSTPKPYADVRDEIAKKLYGQKLTRNVEDYLAKLREASTIAVHLKKAQ